jgi:valyl-tRNA synthetase
LNKTINECDSRLSGENGHDFGTAASILYGFFWGDFCDWYIEMAKDRINSTDAMVKSEVLSVLLHVLERALRLLHPLMPFITEEIWQKVKEVAPQLCPGETIMYAEYPRSNKEFINQTIETDMEFIIPVIVALRNIRAEYSIPNRNEIDVVMVSPDKQSRETLERSKRHIMKLAKVAKIDIVQSLSSPMEQAATASVGSNEIHVPLKGMIDVEKEKARLSAQLEKHSAELVKIEAKLSNQGFMKNAKPELVEEERSNKKQIEDSVRIIKSTLAALAR